MDNKLGTLGTAATVAGIGVAVCNPVGAAILIAGGIAAGIRSTKDKSPLPYSGSGGWNSGESWLPVMQYVLIWSGVTEVVSSVVLLGASLVCAPGCGVDAVSGLWISLLLFVVGMVSTGAGFVYSGIVPRVETTRREYREKETLKRLNSNTLDFAPQQPVTQSSAALARRTGAVAPATKSLAAELSAIASDDDGKTWFVIIDNTVPEDVGDLVLMEKTSKCPTCVKVLSEAAKEESP